MSIIHTPDTPVQPAGPDGRVDRLPLDASLIAARDYWLARIAARTDYMRVSRTEARAERRGTVHSASMELAEPVVQRLERLTSGEPFLLYTVLLAAVHACLHRHSGNRSVATSSPTLRENADPSHPNLVPVVQDVDATLSFRALIEQLRATLTEAYARQHYPYRSLLADLGLDDASGGGGLFDVSVALQGFHGDGPRIPHAMSLVFERGAGGVRADLRLDADAYRAEAATLLLEHFSSLLADGLERPNAGIGTLAMASPDHMRRVVEEWSVGERALIPECSIVEQVFARATAAPDTVAVVAGASTLTYGVLAARSTAIARELRAMGVRPEVRVAVCVDRSPELVIALLAVWQAGGAYVPLDPTAPRARLAAIVDGAAPAVVLTRASLEDRVPPTWAPLLRLDHEEERLAEQTEVWPPPPSDALAYVLYTSGSTGQPKGVEVCHAGIRNVVAAQVKGFALAPDSRVLQYASIGFDASVSEIFTTLTCGATLELLVDEAVRAGTPLVRLLKERAITAVTLPPSVWRGIAPSSVPALWTAISAGEACSASLADAWRGRRFINAYGPTEATVCAAMAVDDVDGHSAPIGRPLANSRVYVLDQERRPVPAGVVGEIYIGGTGLARGYLRQPGATAERFVPDPFSAVPGARLYRTGDLGRFSSRGALEFIGRRDTQVKIRGVRIELAEIDALLRIQPRVQDAVAHARDDGRGGMQLVAYVVPRHGVPPERSALRSALRDYLPEYMVPGVYVFLESLPLTPNGKVDRDGLPEPQVAAGRRHVAPRTPVEEILTTIWADVLGRERVGTEDNFFELGGHSLLATQVVVRCRELLGVDVPLRWIFETPTVAAVAAQVELARRGTSLEPIEPVDRSGPLPLSWPQQRLWVMEHLRGSGALYNVPLAMRIEGALDTEALEHALTVIVSRHEVLRTRFLTTPEGPIQVVGPLWTVKIPVLDCRGLSESVRAERLRALQQEEAEAAFDLQNGPLLRTRLVQLGDREFCLLLTLHHIVSDGWSIGVLVREISELYTGRVEGRAVALPTLPVQYGDFAVWQRRWLNGPQVDAQLAYWQSHLEGAPMTELPTDFPRPAEPTFGNGTAVLQLGAEESQLVQRLCLGHGVTLFMVILGGMAILLQRYTGQDDIVVGTSLAGRTRREIEGSIGFFLNMLALRVRLKGEPSVRALLAHVREVALDAFAHQDIPFERVVQAIDPDRDPDRTPMFRLLLAVQNTPLSDPQMAGLRLTPYEVDVVESKFDLTMTALESGSGIRLMLQYNTDLFMGPTAERLLDTLRQLLLSMAANPDCGVLDLPMLSQQEARQLDAWSHQ